METFAEINSSTSIKKVMWLWSMGRHNLTNDRTDLVPQHLKCCGHFLLKKRTVKYERILNFLALVAQNQQPCRSKSLSLTHIYTNKQTHIHKQTHTAEGGRADQRGVQMDGESLSVPTPSRVICCPICTLTARPPNPRDAHTLAYTHTCIPYLSPHVSWVWHTNFPHPLCSHVTIRTTDAGHLYISLECVWTGLLWLLETFREDITSALHFQLSAYLTLRWSSPRHSALLNMLFDTGTHSANLRSTT